MKPLIPCSSWEVHKKESFQDTHQPLQQAVEQGAEKGYDFNTFTQDLFSSLYQMNPEFPETTSQGAGWAKKALDELRGLPDYHHFRQQYTQCDSLQSGLGATTLAKHFVDSLPKVEQENPDDITQCIKDMQAFLEEHPGNTRVQKQLEQAGADLPEAQAAWSRVAEGLDSGAIRQMWRKAIGEASATIDEINEATEGLGYGDEPGQDGFLGNHAAKLDLAKQVQANDKLRAIMKLAGRLRREARKVQANKKNPGPDEITAIETGADLGRLLPSELMLLQDPDTEAIFMRKFLERGQLQYELQTPEKETRGPIIICIDNSGSMSGAREVWSKAVCLAMCTLAIDQKRGFALLHFNTQVVYRLEFEARQRPDPSQLIQAMTFFSGGGTNFTPVMQEARQVIRAQGSFKKADIIFITDGIAAPLADLQQHQKDRQELGFHLFSICLGHDTDTLPADEVMRIDDLADDETVKEKIFSV